MNQPSPDLTFALQLARESSLIFKKYFGGAHTEWKADNTPLTLADTEINDLIIKRIAETYPGDAVYGEEASTTTESNRLWVIDPVDGTQPFENGIPVSTIVIALVGDGRPQLAVAYDPIADDLYYAEAGKGAYKNDQQIFCNQNQAVGASYFATSSFHPEDFASTGTVLDRIDTAKGKVFNFRSFTYSAMKVAEGKLSGAMLGVGRLYDTIAPALIVTEAGGTATDLAGGEVSYTGTSNGIVVSNGPLHGALLEYLRP
ncbi:MAG TPA: inositol monophosphatase [Verrucomicrobiae bacterium]|nr:inositol monophosphatase [Verrucomicrobiae bacterium]